MKVTPTPTSGAADLPEALIGAIMAAAYDFRDAHISGSKNLKRTAHAELESTVRNTLHALAAGQATAAPENIRGILARCRDFIDTTKAPAYPAGADLADEIDVLLAAQPAPQPSHVAQAVVQDDLIALRKPTTRAEMLWLLKLAHLVISDVGKTLEKTFAPAQPAAQQGVAYAALPDERAAFEAQFPVPGGEASSKSRPCAAGGHARHQKGPTMKIKTKDLTGAALDWAVAKADENLYPKGDVRLLDGKVFTIEAGDYERSDRWQRYSPSTSWAQGGPILDRERITIRQWTNVPLVHAYMPHDDAPWVSDGTSPLVAAMRCFCSFKLGDEVDVPEELM